MEISLDQYIVENNVKQQVFPFLKKKKDKKLKDRRTLDKELNKMSLSDNFGDSEDQMDQFFDDDSPLSDSSRSSKQDSSTPQSYLQWRLGKKPDTGRVVKSYRSNEDFSFENRNGIQRSVPSFDAIQNRPRRHSGLVAPSNGRNPALAKLIGDLRQVLSNTSTDDYNTNAMSYNTPQMDPVVQLQSLIPVPVAHPLVTFTRAHQLIANRPQQQLYTLQNSLPVSSLNQKPEEQPKYDMTIQKKISEVQNKPFAYTCGVGKPSIVSFDGPGVDSYDIKPASTNLSMNCRFG